MTDICGAGSMACSIDGNGDVAGYLLNARPAPADKGVGGWHAFYWQKGKLVDLRLRSPQVGRSSMAMSVAAGPVVLGLGLQSPPGSKASTQSWVIIKGAVLPIAPVAGDRWWVMPVMVNSSGVAVGYTFVSNHPVVNDAGVTRRLPTLGPGGTGYARGINESGDIVGSASTGPAKPMQAVEWIHGKVKRLGGLGHGSSTAFSINSRGIAAGSAVARDGKSHACLYDGGKVRDIGVLNGGSSRANGVNDFGIAVGQSTQSSGKSRAFLYVGGRLLDLNLLVPDRAGWILESACGINNSGQIACTGVKNGERRAFLLTPE